MSFTYDIQARVAANRLYLRMAGTMSDDEAREVADKIVQEIQKLKPGFAVINDISQLKPASPTATEHMKRAQDASVKRGSGRVIRVVGSQAITQMQWSRTLKTAQRAAAETAVTLEEAERMLDQPK